MLYVLRDADATSCLGDVLSTIPINLFCGSTGGAGFRLSAVKNPIRPLAFRLHASARGSGYLDTRKGDVMRRVLVLAVAGVVGAAAVAHADERKLYGKLLFGIGVGDLKTTPDEPSELTVGGTWGGGVEYRLSDKLRLEMRALVVEKASMLTRRGIVVPAPEAPFDVTLSFRYLSMPVLLKAQAPIRLRPYVVAGPEFGYQLSARNVLTVYGTADVPKPLNFETEPLFGRTRRFDLAAAIGAGIETRIRQLPLALEVYVSRGLRNLLVNPQRRDPSSSQRASIRTEAIAMLSTIRF